MKLQYTLTEENYRDFLLYLSGGKLTLSFRTIEAVAAWLLGIQIFITMLSTLINRLGFRVYEIRNIVLAVSLVVSYLIFQLRRKDFGITLVKRAKAEGTMPEGLIGSHQMWFFQDGFRHHFGPFRREKSYSSITDVFEHRYTIYVALTGDYVLIPYSAFSSREEKDEFLKFIGEKRKQYHGKNFLLEKKIRENPEQPEGYYRYHLSSAEALRCLADANRIRGWREILYSPVRLFYLVLSLWAIIAMVFIPHIRTSSMFPDIWSGELVIIVLLLILNIRLLWLFTLWLYSGMDRTLDTGGGYQSHTKPQWLIIRKRGLYWYQETMVTAVSFKEIVDIEVNSRTVCILLRNGFIYLPRGLFPTVSDYLAFKVKLLESGRMDRNIR